jgi:hypothetical protein
MIRVWTIAILLSGPHWAKSMMSSKRLEPTRKQFAYFPSKLGGSHTTASSSMYRSPRPSHSGPSVMLGDANDGLHMQVSGPRVRAGERTFGSASENWRPCIGEKKGRYLLRRACVTVCVTVFLLLDDGLASKDYKRCAENQQVDENLGWERVL